MTSREEYRQAPNDARVAVRYGETLIARAPLQAWDVIQRAVSLAPDDPHVLVRAAMAFVRLGGYDHARKVAPRAARLLMESGKQNGDDALLLIQVQGRLAAEAGNMELAERNLRVAFDSSPDASGLGLELARIYCRQGRLEDGRAVVDRALEVGVEDPELRTLHQWLTGLRGG